jgi:predicted ATP-grasp superfamily ATP-dependent carboligase
MRVLVYEFASGGGLSGRALPVSLAREGSAMLAALLQDLAAIGAHEVVTTRDERSRLEAPPGVEVVTLSRGDKRARLDELIASADAVWLVAPETDRWLERLALRVERKGRVLLGASSAAIREAANKAGLPARLRRHGVAHPETRVLRGTGDGRLAARDLGYPVVVKPGRGAGCEGVCLARNPKQLRHAVGLARTASGRGPVLLQRYVPGVAASVSLISNGREAVALAVNAQRVVPPAVGSPCQSGRFSYRGGATPFDHPLAERAVEAALQTCRALPGLRGFVGVDVVLTRSRAVVIEVNPRLTTAYLGVRSTLETNVAGLALTACAGELPTRPRARQRVRFTASGRVTPLRIPAE